MHSVLVLHGSALPVHAFVFASHEYPVGQSVDLEHDATHAPSTQTFPVSHCDASTQWFSGATHTPDRHFAPGVELHAASDWQAEAFPIGALGFTLTHVAEPCEPLAGKHVEPDGHPVTVQSLGTHRLLTLHCIELGQSAEVRQNQLPHALEWYESGQS